MQKSLGRMGLLLLCTALSATSQIPTVSAISVNAIDHASVNIQFRSNAASWVQLKYGLSSGTYTYTSASYQIAANGSDGGRFDASISLGGLAPGTTYYVLPTARPNQDNDTSICQVSSCGAVEQTFTTLPLPAVHPVPPTPPAGWIPTEPDTSAYAVVALQVNSTTGECVAASNVAAQPGWTAPVTAGDNITKILNKVYYGTVIEFPQAASCKVLQTESSFHSGYVLPNHGIDTACTDGLIDSSTCRWIMFRTHQVNATDFPPQGMRTGPAWANTLATLVVQSPSMYSDGTSPGVGVQNFNGQVFDCYQSGCNHYWFENLEFTHLADATVYPPGTVDPNAFGPYIRFVPAYPDVTTVATTPNYNVVDRVYAHGQPWPSREMTIFSPGGNHWAIMNSYGEANMWFPGIWPGSAGEAGVAPPSASGAVISIPKATFNFNAFDGAPIGMTAAAMATFSGSNLSAYNGVFFGYLNTAGLTIDYQTANGVAMACSGCTATSEAAPSFPASIPRTAMLYFHGHVSGGNAVVDYAANGAGAPPTALTSWRPLGIYPWPGNYAFFDNNYISAIGQTVYNDTLGSMADQTWTHNYTYFPRSKMQYSGSWDGYGYSFRNVFETKQALRWRFEGNIEDGSAAYQNAGNVIYVAGSYASPNWSTGTQDILIQNNIFKHISSGFQCAGGGAQQPPDSPTAARILINNNLWLDLNRDIYNNGGGGFFSGPFDINPGCEDMNIKQNTVDLTKGPGPALLMIGAASNGATVHGEGLNFSNNLLTLSLNSTLDTFWSLCGQVTASHPANPAELCSGGNTGTTYTQMLNTSFIHAGSSITPSWTVSGNVIVGGQTERGVSSWVDLDAATLSTIAAQFPGTGNRFVPGATYAARKAAVNWDPVTFRTASNPSNSSSAGANVDDVSNAAGIVRNIRISAGATSAQFSYSAPDKRACSLDVSTNGTSWARIADNGGSQNRQLVASGLSAGTSYRYRLMCYFDQQAQYEFPQDQITTGTFATAPVASRVARVAFHLPAGAAKSQVSLVPVTGTPVTQSCATSPCALTVPAGSYTQIVTFQTSAGVQVGSMNIASLTVQ